MKSFRDVPERDEWGWQREDRLDQYTPVDFDELKSAERLEALAALEVSRTPPPGFQRGERLPARGRSNSAGQFGLADRGSVCHGADGGRLGLRQPSLPEEN